MKKHIPAMADHWLYLFIYFIILLNSRVHGGFVNITFLESAVQKGAVCLDGSPPAYYFEEGFGSGSNNWVIYIEGGAWCATKSECVERAKGLFGSSFKKDTRAYLGGMLSKNPDTNPDFYNWNKVRIGYCDGSSFMSDVETIDPETNLTLRGARVFNAVIEDLLAKGMKNADNAILTGGSAGGLATILHCDLFRAFVPKNTRVKCIADCGLFLHAKDLPGAEKRERLFAQVIEFHGLANLLPKSCTSRMDPSLCLFPEYLVQDIRTPLFLVDSTFDSWKVEHSLEPIPANQLTEWTKCANQTSPCTSAQLQRIKDFGDTSIETFRKIADCSSSGMFIHSCYIHGILHSSDTWYRSPVLAGKTLAKAVRDWYFDGSPFKEIDAQTDELQRNCSIPAPVNENSAQHIVMSINE